MAENKLSGVLDGKFKLKNGTAPTKSVVPLCNSTGEVTGWEEVDFRTMSVEQAEDLVARNCPSIEKFEKTTTTTAKV